MVILLTILLPNTDYLPRFSSFISSNLSPVCSIGKDESLSLSLYRVFPSQFVGVVYRSGVDEWRDAALHAPRKRHSNNTNVPAEPSIAYIMRVVYCRGVEGMLNDICHLYAPTMDRLVPSVSIDRSIDLPPRDPFSRIRVGCCASIHR